jgi:serine/threonine protein phosphatase PrpC
MALRTFGPRAFENIGVPGRGFGSPHENGSDRLDGYGKVRQNNEDSCLVDDALGLLIVADGMGGHAAGEVASRLAVDVVREQVARGLKTGTIPAHRRSAPPIGRTGPAPGRGGHLANDVIFRASQERFERRGMGTTIVACLVNGSRLSVVHVGDSRFYLFRGGKILGRRGTILSWPNRWPRA